MYKTHLQLYNLLNIFFTFYQVIFSPPLRKLFDFEKIYNKEINKIKNKETQALFIHWFFFFFF